MFYLNFVFLSLNYFVIKIREEQNNLITSLCFSIAIEGFLFLLLLLLDYQQFSCSLLMMTNISEVPIISSQKRRLSASTGCQSCGAKHCLTRCRSDPVVWLILYAIYNGTTANIRHWVITISIEGGFTFPSAYENVAQITSAYWDQR